MRFFKVIKPAFSPARFTAGAHSPHEKGPTLKSFLNRKLVLGATGLVLLGGAGGAVAATQITGSSSRQAYIDDVAKHLNVSPSALTSAMKAAMNDRIDAAVAAGQLTQAQANAIKQRIAQGNGVPFFGHRFGGGGFGGGGFGGRDAAAAQYLGISEPTLHSELAAGKSLSQIASSTSGKSVVGLKAAILAAAKSRLDKEVASGLITSQQEQHRLAALPSRIDSILTQTGIGWPHGGPGLGRPGF
jgi:hypothetical protein